PATPRHAPARSAPPFCPSVFATGTGPWRRRPGGHQSTRTIPTMNKHAALLLLALQLALAAASPIRYDQRQDGDSNIDARLQNFFVVLAPTNSAQLSNTGISLLDLASKAVPQRLRPQGLHGAVPGDGLKQREDVATAEETKEGKSVRSLQAPQLAAVAIPIPAAILQSPLAKLHPEVQAIGETLGADEVLIAQSPVVALRSPVPAPAPAAAAVPMLVAVPVPEVAPERPAAPPALLPMHPAGANAALADKQAEPEAAPAVVAVEEAAPAAAPAVVIAAPEAVLAAAAADDAPAPAPVIVAPAEAASNPAVETNQVDQKEDDEVAKIDSKVHLIGTGIEECGPERVRNEEGVMAESPMPTVLFISVFVLIFFKFCLGGPQLATLGVLGPLGAHLAYDGHDQDGAGKAEAANMAEVLPLPLARGLGWSAAGKCPVGTVYSVAVRGCKDLVRSSKNHSQKMQLLLPYLLAATQQQRQA
ncbi:Titin, partial [Frankliniella fusca]